MAETILLLVVGGILGILVHDQYQLRARVTGKPSPPALPPRQ